MKYIILIRFLCHAASLSAQSESSGKAPSANTLFLEVGGHAIYTLNYERFLRPDISVRMGGSFIGFRISDSDPDFNDEEGNTKFRFLAFPVSVQKYFGSGMHMLETGIGACYYHIQADVSESTYASMMSDLLFDGYSFSAIMGYRYTSNRNFVARIALYPGYFHRRKSNFETDTSGFRLVPGISFGKAF